MEGDFLTTEGIHQLPPTFVGVLSSTQLKILRQAGFSPIILEKNPQALENYFLLFHPKAN